MEHRSDTPQSSLLWRIVKKIVQLSIVLPVTAYILVVIIMYSSPWARKQVIFLNYARNPFSDYSDPSSYGIDNAINFYIDGPAGRLGAWYIQSKQQQFYGQIKLDDGNPVMVYFHGNAYSRAETHRVALYKLLSWMSFHVVAIDYRGFADSEGSPSEQGLIDDGLAVYNWVKSKSGKSSVFIWGHSLGTAVGVGVAKALCDKGSPSSGVILEAPFNSVYDAGRDHKIAKPFKFLPYFQEIVMEEVKEVFRTDKRIVDVYSPILILHDRQDDIILFKYAEKLYQHAVRFRAKDAASVQLIEFDGFGHKWISASKALPDIIRNFVLGK